MFPTPTKKPTTTLIMTTKQAMTTTSTTQHPSSTTLPLTTPVFTVTPTTEGPFKSSCGGDITATEGLINFLQPPDTNLDCVECRLKIVVPKNQVTKFKFQSFNFDASKFECIESVVTIKVGDKVTGIYCSYKKPPSDEFIVTENVIYVDASITWKDPKDNVSGFDLSFEPLPSE